MNECLKASLSPCRSTEQLRSRLKEYGLVTPFSTDSHGHFLSHLLSAAHRQRVRRAAAAFPSGDPERHLFFNISAFGKEFHLRLRPNVRLVAPGAVVEWHDDSDGNANRTVVAAAERTLRRELLKTDCTFVGDITDVPGASVAINNCDGLVSPLLRRPRKAPHPQNLFIPWSAVTLSTLILFKCP